MGFPMVTTDEAEPFNFEEPGVIEFWGGPLDGLIVDPIEQKVPDRKRKLFRHTPASLIHDPDGPARCVYSYCGHHDRMEVIPPSEEAKIFRLEPDGE